jgi:hypothetical protein
MEYEETCPDLDDREPQNKRGVPDYANVEVLSK